ncbi:MAG: hypothetical protein ABWK00_03015 [Desulfurococcaceae archaeon]
MASGKPMPLVRALAAYVSARAFVALISLTWAVAVAFSSTLLPVASALEGFRGGAIEVQAPIEGTIVGSGLPVAIYCSSGGVTASRSLEPYAVGGRLAIAINGTVLELAIDGYADYGAPVVFADLASCGNASVPGAAPALAAELASELEGAARAILCASAAATAIAAAGMAHRRGRELRSFFELAMSSGLTRRRAVALAELYLALLGLASGVLSLSLGVIATYAGGYLAALVGSRYVIKPYLELSTALKLALAPALLVPPSCLPALEAAARV